VGCDNTEETYVELVHAKHSVERMKVRTQGGVWVICLCQSHAFDRYRLLLTGDGESCSGLVVNKFIVLGMMMM